MKLDTNFISQFKKNLPATDEKFRGKAYVFLVCLGISIFIWFLIALSQESVTTLDYPVVFNNLPDDMTLVNRPDSVLSFRISSGGFELITLKYLTRKHPINIDLSGIELKKSGKQITGSFSTADISARFFKEHDFAEGVVSYSPQFITFIFEELKWKKVHVHFNGQLSFSPQYRLASAVRIEPDSVKITGQQQVLDKIKEIETTEPILNDIKGSTDFFVDLVGPGPEIHLTNSRVHVFLNVERFTESTIEIPVMVKQHDIDVKMFPSKVKITFLVSLDNFNRVNPNGFRAIIDLDEDKNQPMARVHIIKKPDFIDLTRIEPESLEYLIIRK